MAITVVWDDDAHTIIRMSSQEIWTLEEFRAASHQAIAMVRIVPHKVYVISDIMVTLNPPSGILWELRDLNQRRPGNWGGGIAIAHDSFVGSLVATFSQIYMERNMQRVFVVKTEDEAYKIIDRLKNEDQALCVD
ncbi:MAG: hypothetical protein ABI835_10115 [Chloroflexota bacterium]